MDLKEFYNSQSEIVKARLKACKSVEEMMKVLDEEKIQVGPQVLESVSGGYLHPGDQQIEKDFWKDINTSC